MFNAFLSGHIRMDEIVKTNEQYIIMFRDLGTSCKSI